MRLRAWAMYTSSGLIGLGSGGGGAGGPTEGSMALGLPPSYASLGLVGFGSGGGGAGGPTEGSMALGLPPLPLPPWGSSSPRMTVTREAL